MRCTEHSICHSITVLTRTCLISVEETTEQLMFDFKLVPCNIALILVHKLLSSQTQYYKADVHPDYLILEIIQCVISCCQV